ncbi:hypothetical protein KPH14_011238 [Odynerus spinipes]|uniref:Uncharacterized protein n=1 Tax=Odynerus spinipes TaxID=1348599 RepID=A0AAD9R9D8_9HYME|nr:hypothetical protein KPH14_011238 [Odynerus spinipes]
MQRTCPSKICVYPSKSVRKTKAQIFFKTTGFLLKSAIVVTLLYWMYTDGTLPFFPDIDRINIPRLQNAKYSLVQKYNHAVLKIMDILVGAPQMVYQKFMSILYTQERTAEEEVDSVEIS